MTGSRTIRSLWALGLLSVFALSSLLTAIHHWDEHQHERMVDCHAAETGDLHWHGLDHELASCHLHELNSPPYQPGFPLPVFGASMDVPGTLCFTYCPPLSQKSDIHLHSRAPPTARA